MFKRRDFLRTCAVSSAVVITPFGWAAAGTTNGGLSKIKFQSLQHQVFHCMDGKGGVIKMELTEVRDGPQMSGIDQFSLVLQKEHALGADDIQAGLYQLYHPDTGKTLVHLEPSDTETGRYTSYFGLFT